MVIDNQKEEIESENKKHEDFEKIIGPMCRM